MAVSIKITESTKRRLERLQSDLAGLGAKGLTLQAVLDAAVADAASNPARVYSRTQGTLLPLSPAARRRVLDLTYDWGGATSEADIDRVLASDEAIHGRRRNDRRKGK